MRSARELWEAAYKAVETADDDALRDLCGADIEIRTSAKQQRGPDALAGLFAQQRGLYTGLEKTVDGVIESADGRAMAAELTLSGLPNGTDERLTWGVVETIRADGDRLVSWHAMLDRTWLVQQIQANQR